MSITITPAAALSHPALFAPHFRGDSWRTWEAVLKAAYAEPLSDTEKDAFAAVAGRKPPRKRIDELVCVVGRGGGKDLIASLIATVAAVNFDPDGRLRPGEMAHVMCIACDRDQAGILFSYIKGYFEDIPALRPLVRNKAAANSIELTNRVSIDVFTNSYRSVRGRSILCAVFDEAAFFRDDTSANPAAETHAAVTPGLARVKGSMLIMISSAHRRTGLLYDRWHKFYGKDNDDVLVVKLVVKGTTLQFNPGFNPLIIERQLEDDLAKYSAEYLSEWRDDLSTWLERPLLEAAVDPGVIVRPPVAGIHYIAGCDVSGGRHDSFTMAIAHKEKDGKIVLDLSFEAKAPLNPDNVIDEIAVLLRSYRVSRVVGDNYGADLTVNSFSRVGLRYEKSEFDRSGIYMNVLPLFTSGRVRLLDNPKMVSQFAALERRTFSTGRERIDPGPGHDDVANSAAIAMTLAAGKTGFVISDAALEASRIPGPGTQRHVPFRFGSTPARPSAAPAPFGGFVGSYNQPAPAEPDGGVSWMGSRSLND